MFGKLVCRRLRRDNRNSVEQLRKSILDQIEPHNGKEAESYS